MEAKKCCYIGCEKDATVKGFVLARDPDGGKDIPTEVYACKSHKNVAGFFETEAI